MQERATVKEVLAAEDVGKDVLVAGWVRTRRDSKELSFLELNDGSCLANLQLIADDGLPNYEEVRRITTGCAVRAEGTVVASPASGQRVELKLRSLEVVGWAPEYPLQKKRHTAEFLRTIAHLRPRTNTIGAVARVRNATAMAIHRFFQERGFLYLQTPIITGSDAEGAGEMFRVTTLDPLAPPLKEGRVDFAEDFFGKMASLTVSGQLEAETFACALDKVYTFGPTFRAENSNTTRHLSEFWMVEPEAAYCDLEGDMRLAEEFLKSIFQAVLDGCAEDMAFFDRWVKPGVVRTLEHVVESEFVRLTYTEAIAVLKESGRNFEFPTDWGADLQSEHERYLTEEKFKRPVIVVDYPDQIKAFYMRQNDDGKTVAAMDVLVPEIGEIIGGSQREERYDVLLQRIKEKGLDPAPYWWYLDLRKYGTVPHAGFGLGFERCLQFITGVSNIRDVIAFPRTPKSAEF